VGGQAFARISARSRQAQGRPLRSAYKDREKRGNAPTMQKKLKLSCGARQRTDMAGAWCVGACGASASAQARGIGEGFKEKALP